MEYRIVAEYSAPTFYDIDTNEELYDSCHAEYHKRMGYTINEYKKGD